MFLSVFPNVNGGIQEAPGNVFPFVRHEVIEILGIPQGDDLNQQLAAAFQADHERHRYHPDNHARLEQMLKDYEGEGEGNGGNILPFAIPE